MWALNSRELFFVAPDGAIMAATVDAHGDVWDSAAPVKVVDGNVRDRSTICRPELRHVSLDGKQFLMVKQTAASQAATPQILMVQHWAEELKQLVAVGR